MSKPIEHYLRECQQRINHLLPSLLGVVDSDAPALHRLHNAMRYALLNGGKRLRPVLVYAAAEANGGAEHAATLDYAAAAVECIHAYSLVHDDLPAMDNDRLRRGQPTCHIAFDEATAILVGDALQTRAFELLAQLPHASAELRLRLITLLGAASGARGMAGGQAIDLQAVDRVVDRQQLEVMHQHKTGALIRAAIAMGAECTGADQARLQALDRYGSAIGLAFQVQDDILDVNGSTEQLGKTQGADAARNKPTYPALLGLEGARRHADELHQRAIAALEDFGPAADRLRELSGYIVGRQS